MGAREGVSAVGQGQLDAAASLLDGGDVDGAREGATTVLRLALRTAERSRQARAWLLLAQRDRLAGQPERAVEGARRAVDLFQAEGEIAGEAGALSLLARLHGGLGQDEEAVDAGLLAVRLGKQLPAGGLQVQLHDALGLAYLWARSFGGAQIAFHEALRIAAQFAAPAAAWAPRVHLAWLECARLFQERYFQRAAACTEVLRSRLAMCAPLHDDASWSGPPGEQAALRRLERSAHALAACWEGRPHVAQDFLDQAQDPRGAGRPSPTAQLLARWVRTEIAWARCDLAGAQDEAARLLEQATKAHVQPMACVGHGLLIQIHAARGQPDRALQEERACRQRELRVRAHRLENRQRIVEGQMEIRSNKQHLRMLSRHSRELERLSYEDSLTGVANRRRFEQQLAPALSQRRGRHWPLCVALIDLDDFKRINDTTSHAAGDEVLRSSVQSMRTVLRTSDLLARLGGDEFVVMFRQTDAAAARELGERIGQQLRDLRWPHLAPELRVSASVGVAQARPGDAVGDLLQRSDAEMFRMKPARPALRTGPDACGPARAHPRPLNAAVRRVGARRGLRGRHRLDRRTLEP